MTSEGAPPARISAVVPALNEAPSIERVVEGLKAQPLLASGEVIVVDNGSTDDTGELARRAGARIVREDRRGYGRACLAGVRAAGSAEIVVLLDGDAADDPDDLPRILAPLLEGEAELVVGSRALGKKEYGSMTWQQVFGNKLASFMMRAIYGIRVTDVGPFRTIRRDDLLALDMQEMTYGWPSEMIVKAARAGYRYKEAPVSYRRRIGVSKVGDTIVNSLKVGWYVISTILRYSRWEPPGAKQPAERPAAEARR